MGVRLPPEYQEVEYIECDGNEYIDTGYYVKSENVRIIISCFTASSYYEYDFIGNQDSSTGRFVFGSVNVGFFLYARDRIGNETNLQYRSDYAERYYLFDATYNLEAGIKSLSVNGITASNSHTRSVISTRSVQVFANGSGTNRRPSGKYYHVTLYDAGALAFDLIPCYRKSDNKTGMYDLVSGGFFTSQGTGEFLVGPDVIYSISPWLVARRRMLMYEAPWTYILVADESGKVPKAKIPVSSGKHIHMEWDTSKYSSNSNAVCIFSFYGQNATFGTGSNGLQESPSCVGNSAVICWNQQISANVVAGGHIDMVAPDNLNMYIGCWNESEYTGASDNRRLIGDFIKIRIT